MHHDPKFRSLPGWIFSAFFYVCFTRRKHSLISLTWQYQYLIQWRVLTYIHTMNLTTFALFSINLFLFHTRHLFAAHFRFLLACFCYTVCPRSSDPFYIVTYNINWVTTSWAHSTSFFFIKFNFQISCKNRMELLRSVLVGPDTGTQSVSSADTIGN